MSTIEPHYISNDSFAYLYKVSDKTWVTDISPEVLQRRINKATQSLVKTLVLDLTDFIQTPAHPLTQFCQNFFQNYASIVYVRPELLSWAIENKLDYKIKIQNANDFNLDQLPHSVLHPLTTTDLIGLCEILRPLENANYEWNFSAYNKNIKNSLTIKDIHSILARYPEIRTIQKSSIPFFNEHIPSHYELEALQPVSWQLKTPEQQIQLSVIIPTYNNHLFLANTLNHLSRQNVSTNHYEIIVVDDGSQDQSMETIQALFQNREHEFNLKYIYWPKKNPQRGDQFFFRTGLCRNLGVRWSSAENLFFLDSDMIVPENFIEQCLKTADMADIYQFTRNHIYQKISLKNPHYSQIDLNQDTYIEEKNYWGEFFKVPNWNTLPQKWKYVCTYAMGLKKTDFYECGRFKRHFISYGFEDTDIGFRMYKKGKKFELVKTPLLHLTHYDQLQYKNSHYLRDQLLRKTAKLFYLDHLDKEIYQTLQSYYFFEKPITAFFRDLF